MFVRFHWALIVGPKTESHSSPGKKFHAKEKMYPTGSVWEYSEEETKEARANMLLVRVQVGKVRDMKKLEATLRSIPIRAQQPGWNCVGWIREALEMLQKNKDVMGTAIFDWDTVRNAAMKYVQKKEAEHRYDGKAPPGNFDMSKAATYDLLEKKELIP